MGKIDLGVLPSFTAGSLKTGMHVSFCCHWCEVKQIRSLAYVLWRSRTCFKSHQGGGISLIKVILGR